MDIATAVRIGAMPTARVQNAAYDLEYGVDESVTSFVVEIPQVSNSSMPNAGVCDYTLV